MILSVTIEPEYPGEYTLRWQLTGPRTLTESDVSINLAGETIDSRGPVEVSGKGGHEEIRGMLDTAPLDPGDWTVKVTLTRTDDGHPRVSHGSDRMEVLPRVLGPRDDVTVTMRRALVPPTRDQALWSVIRNSTSRLGFASYDRFMDRVIHQLWADGDDPRGLSQRELREFAHAGERMRLPFPNVEAYRVLKVATEVFLMLHCGVEPDFDHMNLAEESRRFGRPLQPGDIRHGWERYLVRVFAGDDRDYDEAIGVIPYLALIRSKLQDVPVTGFGREDDGDPGPWYGILARKLARPCFVELIWTFWMSQATLPHTLDAVAWRFQNRGAGYNGHDPLGNLEIDPLRGLNSLLWGYIQDEQHRLTAERVAYECVHEYGVSPGTWPRPDKAADSRFRFMEAFHYLLALCWEFYKEDDSTTVIADGFPVLNALREIHLLIAQGAHNEYGGLPWVARMEGLMQQWILGRPEFREFLPERIMVDHPERWMGRVEAMRTLQGWDDAPVLLYRDLAVFGEQILLSIRFGAWASVTDPEQAANWARYWRAEIQGYGHAVGAVTGTSMTSWPDAGMPAAGVSAIALRGGHALPRNARMPRGNTVPSRAGVPRGVEAPRGAAVQRGIGAPSGTAIPRGER